MNETEKNAILAAVREALTGDVSADMVYLQDQVEKYNEDDATKDVADEIVKIAYGLLTPEQNEYVQKTLYLGGKTLDRVYAEGEDALRAGQTAKAIDILKPLYEHILANFDETDALRFFSFRNLLESNLYHLLYHPTKKLMKTPYDFTLFIGAYAYALVEVRRLDEAIPVLKEAIRFNPVNPDVRFELAEIYKLTHDTDHLLETICDTLPIASSAYAIARCYANLGYWAVDLKDYKSGIAFYYESLLFADDPRVPAEIQHISMMMREPIVPPNRDMINAAFAKYNIFHGPGRELIHTANELAKQAQEGQRWEEAVYYLTVINSLTNDAEAKSALEKCIKEANQLHPQE
ncbi:MAG: hypothetical protein K6F80_06485 [Oscillospiraceae bacterium]|nr:hypothetical protein [Oscillospiraceae bacterium]